MADTRYAHKFKLLLAVVTAFCLLVVTALQQFIACYLEQFSTMQTYCTDAKSLLHNLTTISTCISVNKLLSVPNPVPLMQQQL